MTKCSSGCPTQNHKTYGECLKAKSLQINPNVNDNYNKAQAKTNAELSAYRNARAQGIAPAGTSMNQVRQAEEMSQRMGQAYDAHKPMFDVGVG